MYYLDNVSLSIYIHLLIYGDIVLQSPDKESLEDLTHFAHSLDSPFYNDHEDFTFNEQTIYDENYTRCISYTVKNRHIDITCNNRKKLEHYLKNYARLYKINDLQEWGNTNKHYSLNSLHGLLISTTQKSPNKESCITTDINFAPLILLKYFDNPVFLKSLTVALADTEAIQYPVMIYHPQDSETPLQDNWQDYFVCRYVIDVNWYINDYNSLKSTSLTKKRRIEYAPQQKKMLRIMAMWLKNNNRYNIPTDEFTNKLSIKNIYEPVKKLNEQYREIHGINNSKTVLLKANKGDYSYEISKDFNPDVDF